jgi:hypothetical protein
MGALTLLLAAAMAVTPFLNNAATVLVMAPIAASFAGKLGYSPDPFLMAVAIGAACDFHADRASMQHTGDGPRRLPLRRLLAARVNLEGVHAAHAALQLTQCVQLD